jgi:hypothetical protein
MHLQKNQKEFLHVIPATACRLSFSVGANPESGLLYCFSFLDPGFHRGDDLCDN